MLKSQTTMKNPTSQHENYSLHSYATNHPTFYRDNQTQQSLSPSQFQSHIETLGPHMQTLIESEQTIGKSLMEILEQQPMQNLIQSNKQIPGQLRMATHGQPRMQTLRSSEQTVGKSHMEALEQPHVQTLRGSEQTVGKSRFEALEQPHVQTLRGSEQTVGKSRIETLEQPHVQTLRGSEQTVGKSHMEALEQPHMQNLIQSYKQTRGQPHIGTFRQLHMQKLSQSDVVLGKSHMQTLQQSDMQVNDQSLDYSHQSSSFPPTPLKPPLFSTIRQNNSSSSSASTYSQSLRSETSAYESTLHQPSSSSAPLLDEQDEMDEDYEKKLLSEVEIIDGEGNFLRTQIMTTKEVYKLEAGEIIVVPFNDRNQPIKSAGGLFTRFMTLLVKEPNLCPLDAKDWKECKKRCGIRLLMELRRRFEFPQGKDVDEVVLSHLNEKFRTVKHRMKKSLLALASKRLHEANNVDEDVQYTDDELLQALDLVEAPQHFVDHQWESYKGYLRAPKTKKYSANGKKARGSQVHIHTNGAVSIPRKKDEFIVENKREPDDIEVFDMMHVTKKGSYVDDRSRVFASKAKADFANKLLEVGNSEHVDAEKRLDIAREVMQELRPNKKGRPCGHGVGVTKSQVTKFSYELRRMRRQSVSSENRFLLNKVVAQSKEMEKQGRQMKMMEENMNKFIGQLKTAIPAFFATSTSNAQGWGCTS